MRDTGSPIIRGGNWKEIVGITAAQQWYQRWGQWASQQWQRLGSMFNGGSSGGGGGSNSNEVIIDTNAVYQMSRVGQLLKPGEIPVITKTTLAEINNLAAGGRMNIPNYINQIKVIDDNVDVNTAIRIRELIRGFSTKVNLPGLLGDGRIGGTSLQTGRRLITSDKLLIKAMQQLGGNVTRL